MAFQAMKYYLFVFFLLTECTEILIMFYIIGALPVFIMLLCTQ